MIEHPSIKLPLERRTRLFRIAGAEFSAHGFTQASLNRIIAEMGMSKSSFYHYFKNKTDLFNQMLEQLLAPFKDVQSNFDFDLLTADSFWPTVEAMTLEMTRMANRSPELVMVGRMFYRSRENPDDQALTHDILAASMAWLARLIRRGQALDLVRRDLPDSFIIDIVMALGMSMDQWILIHWDEFSDDERLTLSITSFDMFVRLLAPGGAINTL